MINILNSFVIHIIVFSDTVLRAVGMALAVDLIVLLKAYLLIGECFQFSSVLQYCSITKKMGKARSTTTSALACIYE